MTKLDEALEEINDAIDDAVVLVDERPVDVVREIVASVTARLDKATAAEVRRRFGL